MAKRFEEGILYYTTGVVEIHFPEDRTVCRWCPLLDNDYNLSRAKCLRTGEIIPAPDYMLGEYCPIKFKEEVNE